MGVGDDPTIRGIVFLRRTSTSDSPPWDLVYSDGSELRTLHDDKKAVVGGFRTDQLIQAFAKIAAHEPSTPAPVSVALATVPAVVDNDGVETSPAMATPYFIGTPPAHLTKGGASILRLSMPEYDPVVLFDDDLLDLVTTYVGDGSEPIDMTRAARLTLMQEGRPTKATILLARGPSNSDGSAPLVVGRDDGGGALSLALRPLSGIGGGTIPKEGLAQIKALIESATGEDRISNQAFKDALVSVLYTGTGTPPSTFLPTARPGSICVRSSDQAMFVKEAAKEQGVAIANRDTVSIETGADGTFLVGAGGSGSSVTTNGVDRNPDGFIGQVLTELGTGDDAGQYKWTVFIRAAALTGDDAPFAPTETADTASFLAAINSGTTLPDTRTDRILFFRDTKAVRDKDKQIGTSSENYLAFETKGFETSFGIVLSTQYNFKLFKDQRGTPALVFPAQTETTIPGGWMEQVSTAANTALEVAHARPVSVMEQRGVGGSTTLAVGASGREIDYILSYDPDSIDDEDELGLTFDPGTKRLTLSGLGQGEWLEVVGSCKFRHIGEAGKAVFQLKELRSNGAEVIGGETDLAELDLPAAAAWTTYHMPAVRTRARKRGGTDVFTFRVVFTRTSANPVATATSIQARTSTNHDTAVGFEKTISRGVENLQSGRVYFRDKTSGAFSSYSYLSDMPNHAAIQAGAAGEFLRLNAAKNGYELFSPPVLNFAAGAADTDRALKLLVEETQESQPAGTAISFLPDRGVSGRYTGSTSQDSNLVVIYNTNSRQEGAGPNVPANSFVVGYSSSLSNGGSALTAVQVQAGGATLTYPLAALQSPTSQQHRWMTASVDTRSAVTSRARVNVMDFQRADGTWLFGSNPVKTTRTLTKEALQSVAKGAPAVNSPPADATEGTRVDLLVDWTPPRGLAVVVPAANADGTFIGYGPSLGSTDRPLTGIADVGAGGHAYGGPSANAATRALRDKVFLIRESNNPKTPRALWDGSVQHTLTAASGLNHYYIATSADATDWTPGQKRAINVEYTDGTFVVAPETVKKGIVAYTGFRWVDDSGVTSIVESLVKAYARTGANVAMTLADKNEEQVTALPGAPVAGRVYYRTGTAPLTGVRSELVATWSLPTSGLGNNNNGLSASLSLASGITTKYPSRFEVISSQLAVYKYNSSNQPLSPLPDDVIGWFLECEVGGTRQEGGAIVPRFSGTYHDTIPTSNDQGEFVNVVASIDKWVIVQMWTNQYTTGTDRRRNRFILSNDGTSQGYPANTRLKIYLART